VLLARWLEAAQRRQHYPMDRAAYLLLLRLESDGPSRVATLAAALGLDGSTVTRQVAALEDRGWVTRSVDPDDARATVVTATKAGLAAMNELRRYRRGRVESLFGDWSGAERSELARVLTHLNEVLERNALAPASRTPAQDRPAATQYRRQRPPTAAD
jgi:DNA-binding MarR family transcriptional regulator